MAEARRMPVWAKQIHDAQAREIRELKEQIKTLEYNWESSPISRHVGFKQVFIPDGKIRFELSDHSHIDIRIADCFLGNPGRYLNINGSDYLTINCSSSNLIQVTTRDRFEKE